MRKFQETNVMYRQSAMNSRGIGVGVDMLGDYSYRRRGTSIHPTAIVDPAAQLGENVRIGPYCLVGPAVTLGDGCELKPHVILEGCIEMGSDNRIFSFAVIGQDPQDLKYEGEKSLIRIGNGNRIREHCTIHPGTRGGGMVTTLGNNNLLMVNTHVAHDCSVGDNCILANNVTLGGHVEIGDYTVIGGLSAVHQRVKIGKHAMIGGLTAIVKDVIPYGVAVETRDVSLEGINILGIGRRGFSRRDIDSLRNFYRDVFCSESGNLFELVEHFKEKYTDSKVVLEVIEFLSRKSDRHFVTRSRTNG
ncbi:MAG: acyl-ACP--UDP-N-acetylglucosamine O-acyltransferase [Rickettsiales bacterium]|jgi:UDP-N-acetylglucosamine acyltransferase|nr:acyl-ACP--UDP-N-acetylglucosamine O-acyltransferase [Rickettsiales bacterium]